MLFSLGLLKLCNTGITKVKLKMRILSAFQAVSVLLSFQFNVILTCDVVNWMENVGWSECAKTNTYLRGFYGNDPSGNKDYRLEDGKCCAAEISNYTSQPASCKKANWASVLDR